MAGGFQFDIRKTIDNVNRVVQDVTALTTKDVLVGIPAAKSGRKQNGKINNATLGYIHEFGSPAHNIPARPFLFPGVLAIRPQAMAMLRQGALDALHGKGDPEAVLKQVGMLARNSVVEAITDPHPPFVPLKPETIRRRLMKTAGGRRRMKQIIAGGRQMGMTASQALLAYAGSTWDTGGAGLNVQPLIDTGAMRASITYVVR